ncbi:hypothetical protein TNCV_3752931 [Trichonephila clavipes]|nr:hypothetical protein TNCV_3752931 [Trichonephila clavipes]
MSDAETFFAHKNRITDRTTKPDQFPKRHAIPIFLNRLGTFPTYPQTSWGRVSVEGDESAGRPREGKENVDDKCSVRPQTFHIAENIEEVSTDVRTLAESVGISSATCE